MSKIQLRPKADRLMDSVIAINMELVKTTFKVDADRESAIHNLELNRNEIVNQLQDPEYQNLLTSDQIQKLNEAVQNAQNKISELKQV